MSAEQRLRNDHKRILVIANETCPDPILCARVRERAGENGEVLVVAPALNSRLHHYLSDEDRARRQAQERLTRSVENLSGLGMNPSGAVGDADPLLAIQDALVDFSADEVIIATHPQEHSNWLERGVVDKARARFGLPVTHIVIEPT